MTQALLLVMGSISAAMPVIAAIFGCVVTSFFFAVNRLRKEMVVSLHLISCMCKLHPCFKQRTKSTPPLAEMRVN